VEDTNQNALEIEWKGEEYRCYPSMRCLMMIEERVTLHRLAERLISGGENVPTTHLLWCVVCLLKCAGARVRDEDVMAASKDGSLPPETLLNVAKWLIAETYGTGPEPVEDDELEKEDEDEPGKG